MNSSLILNSYHSMSTKKRDRNHLQQLHILLQNWVQHEKPCQCMTEKNAKSKSKLFQIINMSNICTMALLARRPPLTAGGQGCWGTPGQKTTQARRGQAQHLQNTRVNVFIPSAAQNGHLLEIRRQNFVSMTNTRNTNCLSSKLLVVALWVLLNCKCKLKQSKNII